MNRPLLVVSFTILAIACGSKTTSKPGPGDGGSSLTPDAGTARNDAGASQTPAGNAQEFFDRFLAALCTWSARCGVYRDAATCRAFIQGSGTITFDATLYAIDQGRATLNPSAEAACLQGIANLSCTRDALDGDPVEAACSDAMVGTIGAGAECIDSFECKPGLECDTGDCTATCCAGVCVAKKPLAKVGESCDSADCVSSAYCKQAYNATTLTIEATCQARAALGAACDNSGSCVAGAECVGAAGSRTCVALVQNGAPCGPNVAACESLGSYCDQVKGTCQPRLNEGASCVLPQADLVAVLSAGCLGSDFCKDGLCKPLPLAGQPCSTPDGAVLNECFMVGACVNGICQAREPEPVCTLATAKAAAADAGVRD